MEMLANDMMVTVRKMPSKEPENQQTSLNILAPAFSKTAFIPSVSYLSLLNFSFFFVKLK